jgi:glutaminyl-peptide cyclotransferase
VRDPVVCAHHRVQSLKSTLHGALGALWVLGVVSVLSSPMRTLAQAAGNSQNPPAPANHAGGSSPAAVTLPHGKIWTLFDAARPLAEAKSIAGLGPRPSGSDANNEVRKQIVDHLAVIGWQTTEQRFSQHAPDGREIEFCNLSARFTKSEASTKRILVGAHFDTPPAQEFRDTGASDGAANTAVLIEIARVLATDPKLAGAVELLFIDGDAPFQELNLSDGLFGSRFYAQILQVNRHAGDIQAAVLVENAGGPNLNYLPNSSQNVVDSFRKGATALGANLEPANRSMLADHVPFAQAGIPSITLLDANAPFLKTADDTVDRLSGDSLAKTGSLILYYLATQTATR